MPPPGEAEPRRKKQYKRRVEKSKTTGIEGFTLIKENVVVGVHECKDGKLWHTGKKYKDRAGELTLVCDVCLTPGMPEEQPNS